MKYGFQIVSSIEFVKVRKVVKANQRDLKSGGKGNMSKDNSNTRFGNRKVMGMWFIGFSNLGAF